MPGRAEEMAIDTEARRVAANAEAIAQAAQTQAAVALDGLKRHETHCAERYGGITSAIQKLHDRISEQGGKAEKREQERDQREIDNMVAQAARDRRMFYAVLGGMGSVILLLAAQLFLIFSDGLRALLVMGGAG